MSASSSNNSEEEIFLDIPAPISPRPYIHSTKSEKDTIKNLCISLSLDMKELALLRISFEENIEYILSSIQTLNSIIEKNCRKFINKLFGTNFDKFEINDKIKDIIYLFNCLFRKEEELTKIYKKKDEDEDENLYSLFLDYFLNKRSFDKIYFILFEKNKILIENQNLKDFMCIFDKLSEMIVEVYKSF